MPAKSKLISYRVYLSAASTKLEGIVGEIPDHNRHHPCSSELSLGLMPPTIHDAKVNIIEAVSKRDTQTLRLDQN
jgi:hypothetical protein